MAEVYSAAGNLAGQREALKLCGNPFGFPVWSKKITDLGACACEDVFQFSFT